MSVDRPEVISKPEPFLTLRVIEGDAGTSVSCPELGVSMNIGGANKREVSVRAIHRAISHNANALLRREETGTVSEWTSPNQIDFAKRVIEAERDGLSIADLIKPQVPANVDISGDVEYNAGQN